jgi:hypothetical protein
MALRLSFVGPTTGASRPVSLIVVIRLVVLQNVGGNLRGVISGDVKPYD